ncbi:molybdopterin-dependent oxidoreductase [Rhodoferax saidenbachensis]|uniref:Anaerobic selenocysteine-containing dehydrogenase n=1 Tax=Rhodoferax saidenbachensis TaxID=1484693 RepID=A0ABU1ZTH4_9BURK|nr:molybdopterin-dependent oxidoreductase [Rhodoferax saidenbachensis]MDR7308835.1 anaerobic selenocysteine-containing dehydrogenase [Rhodoferax saidenbachensis]
MSETTHYRICPLCEACCGLEIKVRDQQVVSIRGHEADVLSAGYICPKGVALKDLHEDPDRLRTPRIKRGGVHVEATWEEAFAEIEKRLPPLIATHGRNATGVVVGNPSAHKIGLLTYFAKLTRALGTKNVFSASTLDQMPKQLANGLMYGHWLSTALPDISRTDLMLVIGANPLASNGSMWTVPDFKGKARALQARGGQLIVIDPRRTETAALADAHHFIRPGSDVFLLAALVHTLFAENLVTLGRVADWVVGVEEVQAAVAPFSADVVAPRCGMPGDTIRALARQLATTPRAAVYGRIGTCTQEYGTLASWLVDVLNTLTGHLDAEGGMLFAKSAAFATNTAGNPANKPGVGKGVTTGRHHARVSGAPEVYGELPLTCIAEEIETPGEGQLRALITVATNPVLSSPNGPRLSKALESLDFMVSLDIYLNETTRHADVILPGLSPLEDLHYDVAFPQLSWRNHARYSPPVLPRPEGQPDEWQTLLKIAAIAKGLGAHADANALDDAQFAEDAQRQFGPHAAAVIAATQGLRGPLRTLEVALRIGPYGDGFGTKPDGLTLQKVMDANPTGGIDLGELQPRIPEMLRTPSGKVELAPPMLLQDLQRAAQDLRRPAPDLVIIGRRDVRTNNSWMHNLPLLAKGPFRCTALVHPDDAARHGLTDGAMATLRNGERSVQAQVHVSDQMMPGVVSLPHGWGHNLAGAQLSVAAERPGANINALLDDQLRDPLSGNAVLGGVAITMEAA